MFQNWKMHCKIKGLFYYRTTKILYCSVTQQMYYKATVWKLIIKKPWKAKTIALEIIIAAKFHVHFKKHANCQHPTCKPTRTLILYPPVLTKFPSAGHFHPKYCSRVRIVLSLRILAFEWFLALKTFIWYWEDFSLLIPKLCAKRSARNT